MRLVPGIVGETVRVETTVSFNNFAAVDGETSPLMPGVFRPVVISGGVPEL
jgi:hypothetical protein